MQNLKNKHYFLAEEVLVPNANKTDSARLNMVSSHLNQFLTLENTELPIVFSGFENAVGNYSSAYKLMPKNSTIIRRVELNENYITYIYYNDDLNIMDTITYDSSTNLTEDYGYTNTLVCDPIDGDNITKDTLIYRNSMYDDELNMKIGTNLNALYLAYNGLTFEDSIVVSESAAKKLAHTEVSDIVLVLNKNDILTNLYGTKDIYKPFPYINENIKHGILCARRRLNYNSVLDDFKNSSMRQLNSEDTIFYISGKIAGITIYSNLTPEEEQYKYYEPIMSIKKHQDDYYRSILELYKEYKDNKVTKFSDDLNYLFQQAKDYFNKDLKYTLEGSAFEGIVLKFRIVNTVNLEIGSKITNRYGGKGVISKILPDKDMPRTVEGYIPDIILNPLSIIGRLNPSQLYEQELNFIAARLIETHKDLPDDKFYEVIKKFYSIVNPVQLEFIEETVGDNKERFKEYVSDIKDGNLMIHQPPFFDNLSFDGLCTLYKTFKVEKYKFKDIDNPLIMGKIYFIKLKHESIAKYSVRSAGPINLINIPFKNNEQYKKAVVSFNQNPIRFGEQELLNLILLKNRKDIIDMLEVYSSNELKRQKMIQILLTEDIKNLDQFEFSEEELSNNNTSETIKMYFKGLGINLIRED
jgi:DNA-directed RNA polymerase beta subunit